MYEYANKNMVNLASIYQAFATYLDITSKFMEIREEFYFVPDGVHLQSRSTIILAKILTQYLKSISGKMLGMTMQLKDG